MSGDRASIFGDEGEGKSSLKSDISNFSPRKTSVPIEKKQIEKMAEESGFQSREPKIEKQRSGSSLRIKVVRDEQLTSRVQRKHYELFYQIVNQTGKQNTEVMEKCVEAYARELGLL